MVVFGLHLHAVPSSSRQDCTSCIKAAVMSALCVPGWLYAWVVSVSAQSPSHPSQQQQQASRAGISNDSAVSPARHAASPPRVAPGGDRRLAVVHALVSFFFSSLGARAARHGLFWGLRFGGRREKETGLSNSRGLGITV